MLVYTSWNTTSTVQHLQETQIQPRPLQEILVSFKWWVAPLFLTCFCFSWGNIALGLSACSPCLSFLTPCFQLTHLPFFPFSITKGPAILLLCVCCNASNARLVRGSCTSGGGFRWNPVLLWLFSETNADWNMDICGTQCVLACCSSAYLLDLQCLLSPLRCSVSSLISLPPQPKHLHGIFPFLLSE